jgi:hypothetical protein
MEPFDVLIPAVMGLFLCVTSTLVLRNVMKAKYLTIIYIFPILGWLLDYMENAGVIVMLTNYPSRIILAAKITNLFTMAKSIFDTVSILIICIGIFIKTFNKYKNAADVIKY